MRGAKTESGGGLRNARDEKESGDGLGKEWGGNGKRRCLQNAPFENESATVYERRVSKTKLQLFTNYAFRKQNRLLFTKSVFRKQTSPRFTKVVYREQNYTCLRITPFANKKKPSFTKSPFRKRKPFPVHSPHYGLWPIAPSSVMVSPLMYLKSGEAS